jgi:hypothetical protein
LAAGPSRTARLPSPWALLAFGAIGGLIIGVQPPDLVRLIGPEALTVGGLMMIGFLAAVIDDTPAGFLAVLLSAPLGLEAGFALSFPEGFGGDQPLLPLGGILIGVIFVVPGYVIGRLVAGLIARIRISRARPDHVS